MPFLFLAHVGKEVFVFAVSTMGDSGWVFWRQCQSGGKAQSVAVLSADVLTKEKSAGCHLPDITLSECCATTTLGKGHVKSPCKSVNTSLKKSYMYKSSLLVLCSTLGAFTLKAYKQNNIS